MLERGLPVLYELRRDRLTERPLLFARLLAELCDRLLDLLFACLGLCDCRELFESMVMIETTDLLLGRLFRALRTLWTLPSLRLLRLRRPRDRDRTGLGLPALEPLLLLLRERRFDFRFRSRARSTEKANWCHGFIHACRDRLNNVVRLESFNNLFKNGGTRCLIKVDLMRHQFAGAT